VFRPVLSHIEIVYTGRVKTLCSVLLKTTHNLKEETGM